MALSETERQKGGNELVAAEFLWGAFAHCLITFAQNEGLPHDSHRSFRHIARELAAKQNLERWLSDFKAAEQLHVHFYHGDLGADVRRTHTIVTTRAVQQLLQMLQT